MNQTDKGPEGNEEVSSTAGHVYKLSTVNK